MMRVTPGTRAQLGSLTWAFTRLAGRRMNTRPPALFTVLGRHRRLFRGWLLFAATLMPGGRLPRRETELVILRVASLRGSDYELAHHDKLARTAGLTATEIQRLREGKWTGRDAVLLEATDALVHTHDLTDDQWARLRTELSEVECLEFCLLIAHYDMLATVIHTLRIPPDPPRR